VSQKDKNERSWEKDVRSTTKGQQLLYFDFAASFSPSLGHPALLCPSWLLCSASGVKTFDKKRCPGVSISINSTGESGSSSPIGLDGPLRIAEFYVI